MNNTFSGLRVGDRFEFDRDWTFNPPVAWTARDYMESAFKASCDSARQYAAARMERVVEYESPTLYSDLAYREARMAAHIRHAIDRTF